jgi:hypothetical protein
MFAARRGCVKGAVAASAALEDSHRKTGLFAAIGGAHHGLPWSEP